LRRVQITKLLFMQFSPFFSHLIFKTGTSELDSVDRLKSGLAQDLLSISLLLENENKKSHLTTARKSNFFYPLWTWSPHSLSCLVLLHDDPSSWRNLLCIPSWMVGVSGNKRKVGN
jgi:hypothetical protein